MEKNEPKEAFHYKAPDKVIKEKYNHIFKLDKPVPKRVIKSLFDRIVSVLGLLFAIPILVILKFIYVIEGLIIPENQGPMFFSYNAISAGKVFPKYKVRLIKMKYIDQEAANRGDWHAFSGEWLPNRRTYVGNFVKRFYLDELPQLYNILRGDMSLVGPRPLAVHHYERDMQQGNITRSLIKGGLIGLGHVMKGTSEMGQPIYEYEYIDQYLKRTSLGLLWLDLTIIWRGFKVILQGKGL